MALLRIEPPPNKEATNFDSWISRLWDALRSGATQIALGSDVTGTLPVANGGTGATTAANARVNLDVPKRDGTDATGTWSIAITGNATTVTNGVYSNGSYNDPSWLTGISVAKVNCTTTNNNASAGDLGEYLESVVDVGSAISLTTSTLTDLTSLSLTAGDWDVRVFAVFDPATSTTVSDLHVSVSATSATHDTSVGRYAHMSTNLGAGSHQVSLQLAQVRISLATTTTFYAVVDAVFAASTCTVYGLISARRVR